MKMGSQFWAGHVADAKLAGISARKYAKHHSISVKGLYYWQHKLNTIPTVLSAPSSASPASKFVALRVAPAVAVVASSNCTLIMAAGFRLEMAALPAPEWLAALGVAVQGAH